MSKTAEKPTAKKAFVRAAAGYELFGEKLEPFSAMRQAAAAGMGFRFGMVDEADIFNITTEQLIKKKVERKSVQFYSQMFSDVVTGIWLCTVPMSRVLRALRKPDEAKQDAYAWADKKHITLTSNEYFEAAGALFTIMRDITVSTVVPDTTQPGEDDDEDDEGND
jgi:hypothetical protein